MAKTTSNDYKKRIDTSVRPQDDFYGYANNTWLKNNPIPAHESRWGSFDVLRDNAWSNMHAIYTDLAKQSAPQGSIEQQASDFYYTGMHADELEQTHLATLKDLCAFIDTATTTSALSAVIGKLHRIGPNVPWRIIIDADDKDSSKHIVRFAQGGLTLPNRDYYLEDSEKMRTYRQKYAEHLKKVYENFSDIAGNSETLQEVLITFETALAKTSKTPAELRDVEANYNKTTYAALQKNYPNIDWPAYAKELGWKPSDSITVDQPTFLAFINQQFTDLPLESWRVYLKWQLFKTFYGRISERYAQLRFEFFGKVLSGTQELLPQWKRVVLNIDDALGEGVGRLYAKKHFSEASKQQVLGIVELIRQTYANRIKNLDWMSEPTKKTALLKLKNFKVLIGYPDAWRDYSKLRITRDSYIANIIESTIAESDFWLTKLHQPTSRDDWFMFPQTVNAYSDPNRNVICFPAAILQAPFFDPAAPLAANLGGIGAVIGHELTHGFDDQGSEFDENGNVRVWQTKTERAEFAKRTKIIINQADAFEVLPGVTMKGQLVIGESIADLGGIELAYEALQNQRSTEAFDGLSANEVFFINAASCECAAMREDRARNAALTDPHPTEEFRVNGILSHVNGFYDTFGVKEGDRLYRHPKDRAKIW